MLEEGVMSSCNQKSVDRSCLGHMKDPDFSAVNEYLPILGSNGRYVDVLCFSNSTVQSFPSLLSGLLALINAN